MIKKAFTLAEVLMVIGILGVVAAVTIPNMSNNVSSEQNVAKLRAAYSQINTAVAKVLQTKEKSNFFDVCGYSSDTSYKICVGREIADMMDAQCKNSNDSCFIPMVYSLGCAYSFIASSGFAFCSANVAYKSNPNFAFVDIDGPSKGANRIGEDIFVFDIGADGLEFRADNGRSTRRNFSSNSDETIWAFIVGNQDYLKCADTLQWGVKEGCQ